MTNLTVCEKLALEEVFECLKDQRCRKSYSINKRYIAYRMMKFYVVTRRFLWVRR